MNTHHGICLPLSSLHSKMSCGIGEFLDLLPLINWCQTLKIDVIQLLPLNSSEHDPSPYNSTSSCALNFEYLSLHALPFLEEHSPLKKELLKMHTLCTTQRIQYTEVYTHKLNWLHTYADQYQEKILLTPEAQQFIASNPWVKVFALFCTLKDRFSHTSWTTWSDELKYPTQEEYEHLLEHYAPDCAFYLLLQFLCYEQLRTVKTYANAHNILLMGDLPFVISKESADVWFHPDLFNCDLSAGAPPDTYNKEGQNWGLPLYNWEEMKKTNYRWWKERLSYASHFYDLYRLDHVIGLFRIWAIPPNAPSSEGKFLPEKVSSWGPQGQEILEMMLESSPMLPIAEDLGTVPSMVRPCLKNLGICGTKVMRWERNWETDKSFIPPQNYPTLSLTTISTHDSETLSLWWTTYPQEAKDFAAFKRWEYSPTLTREQRFAILWDSHHTPSLFHINLLSEYLALFPELIWDKPEDERINVPGTVLPTNWTYRIRPSLEELTTHPGLQKAMQQLF